MDPLSSSKSNKSPPSSLSLSGSSSLHSASSTSATSAVTTVVGSVLGSSYSTLHSLHPSSSIITDFVLLSNGTKVSLNNVSYGNQSGFSILENVSYFGTNGIDHGDVDLSGLESVIEETDSSFELQPVKDPYQSIIEWLFILTSVLALFFNISAIVLIFSHFRRRHGNSRLKLCTYLPKVRTNNQHQHGNQQQSMPTLITVTNNNSHNSSSAIAISSSSGGGGSAFPQRHHSTCSVHGKCGGGPNSMATTNVRKIRTGSGSTQLRIYLVNLFVNDILIALFTTPFTYTDFMYGQWIYPAVLCPVTNFISTCAVSVSIYTLIAIGLERYFAIICPFKKLVPFERHTRWIIALIWVIGIALGSPTLIQSRAVSFNFRNHQLLDCRENWEGELGGKIYTGVLFGATFLVPFVALTYLYVSIAVKTFQHVTPGNADASRDQLQLRKKIRMVKMLVLLVITFAVCWLPIQSFNMVMWLCDQCRSSFNTPFLVQLYVIIWICCQWLSVAHSLIDPIIYCFSSRNFKLSEICDELGTIGKLLICCCLGSSNTDTPEDRNIINGSSRHQLNSSASEIEHTRRLSRTSITSSLPSSGRNSITGHMKQLTNSQQALNVTNTFHQRRSLPGVDQSQLLTPQYNTRQHSMSGNAVCNRTHQGDKTIANTQCLLHNEWNDTNSEHIKEKKDVRENNTHCDGQQVSTSVRLIEDDPIGALKFTSSIPLINLNTNHIIKADSHQIQHSSSATIRSAIILPRRSSLFSLMTKLMVRRPRDQLQNTRCFGRQYCKHINDHQSKNGFISNGSSQSKKSSNNSGPNAHNNWPDVVSI